MRAPQGKLFLQLDVLTAKSPCGEESFCDKISQGEITYGKVFGHAPQQFFFRSGDACINDRPKF